MSLPFNQISVALLATLASCAATACVPWQQGASSESLGCAAADIVISDPSAGALKASWKATCRGTTYLCTAPASADDHSTPICTARSARPQVSIVPLNSY